MQFCTFGVGIGLVVVQLIATVWEIFCYCEWTNTTNCMNSFHYQNHMKNNCHKLKIYSLTVFQQTIIYTLLKYYN